MQNVTIKSLLVLTKMDSTSVAVYFLPFLAILDATQLSALDPVEYMSRGSLNSAGFTCPPFKRKSPEISLSPFQVTSQLRRTGSYDEKPITIIPLSARTLSKLGIVLLPNHEVCIRGKKLGRIVLPSNPIVQFEMMTGIGIWFSPCIQAATYTKKN